MRILLRAIDVDTDLQNNVKVGELSEGMHAALRGVWSGRAVWRDAERKKLEAEIEALKAKQTQTR